MGRQGRAEATRVAVLPAAAEIFLGDGYWWPERTVREIWSPTIRPRSPH